MSAPVRRKCPECEKLTLKRLIGRGAGVIFKGSGFYETDYRSDSYKKGADADKKAKDDTSKDKKDDAKAGGEKKTTKKNTGNEASQKKPKSNSKE